MGIEVQALTEELAHRLAYPEDIGVLISSVQPGSVAERAGLRRGDEEINRRQVKTLDDYDDAMEGLESGQAVLLVIRRGQSTFFAAVRVPQGRK